MEDLTDDEALRRVYRGHRDTPSAMGLAVDELEHRDTPIAMGLARCLGIANDKLDATETQKGKSNES